MSLKYKDVKNYIEIESNSGCILIDDSYKNNTTPLKIKCKCGEIFYKDFAKFKDRHQQQCKGCGYKNGGLLTRTKYIDIKRFIEEDSNSGCKLITLESDYTTEDCLIDIRCSCGDIYTTTFKKFKSKQIHKQQCDKCGCNIKSIKMRKKYFDVKKYIENKNCFLITKEEDYICGDTILDIQCKCGNIFKASYSMFSLKINPQNTCEDCRSKNARLLTCLSYESVVKMFKDQNCKLTTTYEQYWEIRNNKSRVVSYICSCGNKSKISIDKFQAGHRCRKCVNQRAMQTFRKNYGVDWAGQSPEIRAKAKQTLYENGNAPCSNQQKYINNLFNGKLNYPIKTLSLDVAFPNEKLYLEYDGGLHRGRVVYKQMTNEEFDANERNRTYALFRSGWKEIRIISTKDWLPSDSILLDMLSHARNYLQSHHYIKFDIDNSCVINSQGSFPYSFGELRQITKRDLKEIA